MVKGAKKLIILDTNALITFLKDKETESSNYNLFSVLKNLINGSIALPTPVISEFIAGDNNEGRGRDLLKANSKFRNLDFDAKSALISARIYRNYRASINSNGGQRPNQKVKVDIQILGIAVANQAKSIVTRDNEIKKIISVLNLPIEVLNFDDQSYFEQMFCENKSEVVH